MSNDYFKAQGWFKNYATSSEDSRGVFQELVKEDEEAFRLASAKTDRIKAMMNEKYGPGTIKYGSEIKQPEIKTPQAAFEFSQRNPAADGGRMRFNDGKRVFPNINKTDSGKYEAFYKNNSLGRKSTLEEAKLALEEAKKIDPSKVKAGVIRQESLDKLDKLEQIIEKENSVYKRTFKRDILKEAGWPNAWDSLDTKSDTTRKKVYELFKKLTPLEQKMENYVNNVMLSEDALVKDFKSPMKHLAEKFNVSSGYMEQNFAKNSKAYKENKKLFTSLRNKLSFNKYSQQRADGTFMTIDELSTNQFNKSIKSGLKSSPDAGNFIMNSAYRNYVESVEVGRMPKVTFLGDPRIQDPKEWKFEYKGKIYGYDVGPADEIVDMPSDNRFHNKKVNNLNLTQEMGKKIHGKIFPDVYKAVDDYNEFMEIKVLNPKNGKQISLDKLNRDANYAITGNKNFLTRSSIDYDHFNQLEEPFDNIRILDRRVNQAAGTLKSHYRNEPEKLKTFLNGVGYNKKYNSVAEYADDLTVKNQIIMDPKNFTQKKGKLVYTGPEVGTPYQEYKKFEKIKTQDVLKDTESYITDRTGKVKPPSSFIGASSGFNTDLIAEDLKKIMDTEGFKTFKANIADPALEAAGKAVKVGSKVAALPTKVFGGLDLVLGYLDYTNNRQKGFSKADSTKHMVDAILFGATSLGEKADIEGVRKIANKNGMSNEVFDNLMAVNTNQKKFMDTVSKSKAEFNESMDIMESGVADPMTEKLRIQKLKVDTKKSLTNTMKNIVKDSRSLETNLQVQEAGAPININVDKEKAFSDLGSASRDFVQTRIDASDPKVFDQGNSTMGKIGNIFDKTLLDKEFMTKFAVGDYLGLADTKAIRNQKDMQKLKQEDPTMYYKMLQSEGIDPRINLNIPVQLEFEQKYADKFGTQMSDTLTQNKAEGGIIGLRSKYEYKK